VNPTPLLVTMDSALARRGRLDLFQKSQIAYIHRSCRIVMGSEECSVSHTKFLSIRSQAASHEEFRGTCHGPASSRTVGPGAGSSEGGRLGNLLSLPVCLSIYLSDIEPLTGKFAG
jgi:hypothetical protein